MEWLDWRIGNPCVGPSGMTFVRPSKWHLVRKRGGELRNVQSEDWICCVSLATRKCDVWHNVLCRTCRSIWRHFKRYVNTVIGRYIYASLVYQCPFPTINILELTDFLLHAPRCYIKCSRYSTHYDLTVAVPYKQVEM